MAVMNEEQASIADLAQATGLTRRAVRFYVQQQLLPPPIGLGRGAHYNHTHLERLQKIIELQQAGYSLDAIRKLLRGENVSPPIAPPRHAGGATMSAELWTRLHLLEGVELHFDASRHQPQAERLVELRKMIEDIFKTTEDDSQSKGDSP